MKETPTIIVAVPARLESSRLPNKVLADISGKPMLQRVLERCSCAQQPIATVLCTDNQLLVDLAKDLGFPALLTSPNCESGSQRIASVSDDLLLIAKDELKGKGQKNSSLDLSECVIINVQGDQPFIDPKIIDLMADQFVNRSPTPSVLTPIYRLPPDKIHNPNVVKTLLSQDGRAIYFSRSALPHVRGEKPEDWSSKATFWGHVGIYGYRGDVLQGWNNLPDSPLERIERLEQLRLIEAGIEIGTFIVDGESLSVDTYDQLEQARRIAHASESGT